MSEQSEGEGYQPDLETDEEKEKFIRGVMMSQVWAMVVEDAEPEDIAALHEEDERVAEEYEKLLDGEEHEFGVAVADHYGVPYTPTKNGIKLQQPWGKRYEKAWVKLGVEPSIAERVANAVFFGVMSRE